MTKKNTRAAMTASAAMPPTTPPAMAPALELFLVAVGDGGGAVGLTEAELEEAVVLEEDVAEDEVVEAPGARDSGTPWLWICRAWTGSQVVITAVYAHAGTAVPAGITCAYCPSVISAVPQSKVQSLQRGSTAPWQYAQALIKENGTELHVQREA